MFEVFVFVLAGALEDGFRDAAVLPQAGMNDRWIAVSPVILSFLKLLQRVFVVDAPKRADGISTPPCNTSGQCILIAQGPLNSHRITYTPFPQKAQTLLVHK